MVSMTSASEQIYVYDSVLSFIYGNEDGKTAVNVPQMFH